jgi:serine/threonine protein kinase
MIVPCPVASEHVPGRNSGSDDVSSIVVDPPDCLAKRYAFERELGRGGMATVSLARDLTREKFVAVKVLLPELAVTLGQERFLRGIQVGTASQHPRIVGVSDSGQAEGLLYYVMPSSKGRRCVTGSIGRSSCPSTKRSGSRSRSRTRSPMRTRRASFTATSSRRICRRTRRWVAGTPLVAKREEYGLLRRFRRE